MNDVKFEQEQWHEFIFHIVVQLMLQSTLHFNCIKKQYGAIMLCYMLIIFTSSFDCLLPFVITRTHMFCGFIYIISWTLKHLCVGGT